MLLNVLTHPNDKLRQKSQPVKAEEISSKDFKKLVKNMMETMIKKDGVGLAAPQIDSRIRVIVVAVNNVPEVFINPVITRKSWRKNIMEEGCLSIPGVYKKVRRPAWISMKYLDKDCKEHKIKVGGFGARVFQHEVDHLDGILFIDKAL